MSDSINALIGAQRGGSVLDRIANPPTINPLGGIQAGADAAKTVMGVRALAGQQAWGEALQQATDRNTGVVDYPTAMKIAAGDPRMPLAMASAAGTSSQLSGEQLNQNLDRLGVGARATASLMNDPSDTNLATIGPMLSGAGFPKPYVDAQIARFQAMTPDQRRAEAYNMNLATHDTTSRFARSPYAPPALTNTGSTLQPAVTTPASPGQPATTSVGAGTVPLSLTPGERAQPFTYNDPDTGQSITTTVGDLSDKLSAARRTAPVPAGTPPPAVAPPPKLGGIATAPTPDVAAKWKASTDQYNTANEAAGNYQQRIFPLVQAYNIIKSGTVTTGQSADAWNQIRGTLQTAATKMGWDAQSIAQANSEQLAKYTQQYINAQGMSARSDQALASAITGNPGSHISTLANEQVMPAMIGMERMRQMLLADFKAQPGDKSSPRNFSDFSNTWQNTHDPRAFIFDMMGDGERTKMIQSMAGNDATSKAARKRFSDTLDIVERNPGIMGQAGLPH